MLAITLTLLLLLVGLAYVYMRWDFNYWRRRGIPGPKPHLFTGNYPSLYTMKQHLVYDVDAVYRQYKNQYDAVGIFLAHSPQLLIVNPQLARRILTTHFKNFHDNEVSIMTDEKSDYIFANNTFTLSGDKWKARRADVIPGLTQSRIKAAYPVTNEVCRKMSDWLSKQIRLGPKEGIDAKDLCLRFTSELVIDYVLGLKAENFTDKPTPILANIKELFAQPLSLIVTFIFFSLFPSLLSVFKMRFVPLKSERFFINLMKNAVSSRRLQMSAGKKIERNDFLDYLLQLAEKRNLDTRQLTAYSMTFQLEGFETTAGVLTNLLLFLGRDQKVQQKLRDEVTANLNADGVVEFDKLNELPYLDACIQECIRIFPPGFLSNKVCTESLELPNWQGKNFVVERGTIVVLPHYCYMMDDDHFPNPQEYNPERFMEPGAAKMYRERGVLMGFSDGPRICLGLRFAMAQMKAAAVEIITKFNIRVNPKTRTDNLLEQFLFIANLRGGVHLDFELRQ